MFTGIVEAVAPLVSIEAAGEISRLVVESPEIASETRLGDSVAVNGCCLTVCGREAGRLHFDAVRETLDKTSLGDLTPGARVNLERALCAGGRFDGHIVQGHVDGTGRVRSLERHGDDVRLAVDCAAELARYLVPKGSVSVDGVSLTVARLSEEGFDVALIPHTLAETNLGERRAGDRVNLEVDVLGKYVVHYLDRTRHSA